MKLKHWKIIAFIVVILLGIKLFKGSNSKSVGSNYIRAWAARDGSVVILNKDHTARIYNAGTLDSKTGTWVEKKNIKVHHYLNKKTSWSETVKQGVAVHLNDKENYVPSDALFEIDPSKKKLNYLASDVIYISKEGWFSRGNYAKKSKRTPYYGLSVAEGRFYAFLMIFGKPTPAEYLQ